MEAKKKIAKRREYWYTDGHSVKSAKNLDFVGEHAYIKRGLNTQRIPRHKVFSSLEAAAKSLEPKTVWVVASRNTYPEVVECRRVGDNRPQAKDGSGIYYSIHSDKAYPTRAAALKVAVAQINANERDVYKRYMNTKRARLKLESQLARELKTTKTKRKR
jgi:hypothetical protein